VTAICDTAIRYPTFG